MKKSTTINDPIKFNFNVEAIGDDLGSNYKMNFTSSKSATLNGQEPNVWFDVQKGNQSFIINPTEIGDNDITINVKNDYGVQKTINLRLTVINYSFSFTAVTTGTTALLNKTIPVSFNISPIGNDAGQSYQIKYIVEEGKADIESFTTAGIYKDTSKGEFLLNVTPKTLGNLRIRFFVKNTAGTIQEQVVSLVSSLPEFSFTATPQKTTLLTGEVIPVNTQLLAIDDDADQNYEFMFVTPTGNAEIAGYEKGVWKSISKGVFPLNIKFLNVGVNEVVMKVRNTSGNEKTQTISVEASQPSFEVSSAILNGNQLEVGRNISGSANINRLGQIKLTISSDTDVVKSYRVSLNSDHKGGFYIQTSEGTRRYFNGETIDLPVGEHTIEYEPTGDPATSHNITLQVSNGFKSISTNVTFEVLKEETITFAFKKVRWQTQHGSFWQSSSHDQNYKIIISDVSLNEGNSLKSVEVFDTGRGLDHRISGAGGIISLEGKSADDLKNIVVFEERNLDVHNNGWYGTGAHYRVKFTLKNGKVLIYDKVDLGWG